MSNVDKLVDWWVDNRSKRGLDLRTDNENRYNGGDIVLVVYMTLKHIV